MFFSSLGTGGLSSPELFSCSGDRAAITDAAADSDVSWLSDDDVGEEDEVVEVVVIGARGGGGGGGCGGGGEGVGGVAVLVLATGNV